MKPKEFNWLMALAVIVGLLFWGCVAVKTVDKFYFEGNTVKIESEVDCARD